MKFLEEDLEQMIWEASQTDDGLEKLFNRGFPVYGRLKKQVRLMPYGVIDLMNIHYHPVENDLYIRVYELKKDTARTKHLKQLCRYMAGVMDFVCKQPPFQPRQIFVNGFLIARDFNESTDMCFLYNQLDQVKIYTYDFSLDQGLEFEEVSRHWKMKDEFDADKNFYTGLHSVLSESTVKKVRKNRISTNGQNDGQ